MIYDIHGILKISSNIKCLPSYFMKEGEARDVDLVIREGDFKFNKIKHKKLGLKFYGGNENVYLDYPFYGLPIQKLLISDLFGKETRFYFHRLTNKLFGIQNIIDLLIEIKLIQKGYTMLHAAAVSKNEKGYLISGWSEMGKTSTTFALCKKGFEILGDDVVILSKDGKLYAFPEKAGIFFHTKNIAGLKLPLNKRMKIGFRYAISKIPPLHLYVNTSEKIDITNIAKIKDSVPLKRTYLLEWGKKSEKKITKEEAINKLIATTQHSFFEHFFLKEIFLAYCYLNDTNPDYIAENMEKILKEGLSNCVSLRTTKKDYYLSISRKL
jgi:hypothetical protein